MTGRPILDDTFAGTELDRSVWFPYYLPHWSSRSASVATYAVTEGALRLSIPPDQGLWCADSHPEPLRVSCVQTGSFSGPVGSSVGQQPFRDGLVVAEEQPTMWGYTPQFGQVEVTMRATLTPSSMFACWLAGIEDRPEHSGELCVVEVFGDAVADGHADVGIGLHAFRDPALVEEWSTVPLTIGVAEFHSYGVQWAPGTTSFTVDGVEVRRIEQAPDYPMQIMLGVFDFPAKAATDGTAERTPELVVSHVSGRLPL